VGVIFVVAMLCECAVAKKTQGEMFCYRDTQNIFHITDVVIGKRCKNIKVLSEDRIRNVGFPRDYTRLVEGIAKGEGVNPNLIMAIIKAESNFQPHVVSPKGAIGLMQLMPSTALEVNVKNPFNPRENILGGTKYLKTLLDYFEGDLRLALAAYNCGIHKVRQHSGIPPFSETRRFVKEVMKYYKYYTTEGSPIGRRGGDNVIYRYRDSAGVVHISNIPLSGTW
jgi:soluble lytic murein transglycosylase